MRVFFFVVGLVFIVAGITKPVTDHPRKTKMVVGLPRYKEGPARYGSRETRDAVISEKHGLILIKTLSIVGGLAMIWISRYPPHRISTVPVWLRFQRRVRRKRKVKQPDQA